MQTAGKCKVIQDSVRQWFYRVVGWLSTVTGRHEASASFLIRLGISYVVVMLVVGLALIGGFLLFFQTAYEGQLRQVQGSRVANLEQNLRSRIVVPAHSVAVEIVSHFLAPGDDFFGLDEGAEGNAVKLYVTFRQVSALADRYPQLIRAINVYYPKAGLVVSNKRGLVLTKTGASLEREAGWCSRLTTTPSSECWLFESPDNGVTGVSPVLTMLRPFPVLSSRDRPKAVVAVEFSLTAIQAQLAEALPSDGTSIWLSSPDGEIVAVFGQSDPGRLADPVRFRRAVADQRQSRLADLSSLDWEVAGTDCQLNVVPVPETGWTLVAVTPLSRLFKAGDSLKFYLILVGLAAVGLGLWASVTMAYRLNRPMVAMAEAVRHQRPAIRQDFLQRVLSGLVPEGISQAELSGFIGFSSGIGPWKVLVVEWQALNDQPAPALAKYVLAESLEHALKGQVQCSTSGGEGLRALWAGLAVDWKAAHEAVIMWQDTVRSSWNLEVFVATSGPVSGLEAVPKALSETLTRARWRWFFPEFYFLDDVTFQLPADTSSGQTGNNAPDPPQTETLDAVLKSRKVELIASWWAFLRQELRMRHQAIEESFDLVTWAIGRTDQWIVDLGLSDNKELRGSLPGLVRRSVDIDECIKAVLAVVQQVVDSLERTSDQRMAGLISKAQTMIVAEPGADWSLERLATLVGLSPAYVSRMFREQARTSFMSFLTEVRLDEALRLLADDKATVVATARQVGFRTPAWFIKQFKLRFGRTPEEYRRWRRKVQDLSTVFPDKKSMQNRSDFG